jgi:hypothetical protein
MALVDLQNRVIWQKAERSEYPTTEYGHVREELKYKIHHNGFFYFLYEWSEARWKYRDLFVTVKDLKERYRY